MANASVESAAGGAPVPYVEPQQRFAVNGVELAWDSWGDADGPPLVLCHGFSGSAHDFSLLIEPLARTRRVLAIDHRGHGRSTKTHDSASYTIDQLVADFVVWLEANAPSPVDLLGHSMGGRVALGVVLQRPDLVRSLVLMDTSARAFLPEVDGLRDQMFAHFDKFDPTRGLRDTPPSPEEPLIAAATPVAWQDRKAELSAGFDPYAYKGLGRLLFDEAATGVGHRLGEITCPTTVIAGSEDHPLIDQAPALVGDIAGARLSIIEGAYHSPQLTHAAEWTKALTDHLGWSGGA